MKWHWSVMDIPELKNLPPLQVRKIFLNYYWQTFQHWSHWVGIILFLLLAWLYYHWIIDAINIITIFIVQLIVITMTSSLFMGVIGGIYNHILLNGLAKQIRKSNDVK